MADPIDPESFGPWVEFTPADRTAERALPTLDVAAPAPPPEPSAEAQEIVFSPPGASTGAESLHLFFETDAEGLPMALAQATESLYVMFGRRVLLELEAAFRGTSRDVGYGVTAPAAGQGEPLYRGAQMTPKRHKLITAYPTVARKLADRIDVAIAKTGPVVTAWAIEELRQQQKHVVDQAFRYLLTSPGEQRGNPDSRRAAIATHLRSSPFGVEISGPAAAGLVGALREVRPFRDAMSRYKSFAFWRQVERRTLLGLAPLLSRDPIGTYQRASAIPVLSPEEVQADVDFRTRIAAHIERIAVGHPVIHRLWTTDAVDLVKRAQDLYPRANDDELALRLSTENAYRDEVGKALKDTLDACTGMIGELRDPDRIWHYSVAMRRALRQAGVARGSLLFAAAEERMEIIAGPSIVNQVNELVGYLQLAALALGVTAPGAAALEIASFGLSVLEAVEEEWKRWHDERASKTHLNPGLSFAADPSYAGVLIAVLGVGVNALGLRGKAP